MNNNNIFLKSNLEQEKVSADWDSNPDPLISSRVP